MGKVTSRVAPGGAAGDKVFACVDPDEVCRLALDLCAIPSPTGDEQAIGEFILGWLASQGLRAVRQDVDEGRVNAVGILEGRGGGPTLMFNGHMDMSPTYRHEEITGPVPPPPTLITPHIADGVLYGSGMDNMKSGLAAILSAAAAIHRSGVALGGDLTVACVAGEVDRAPVDQYQGRYFRSEGIGTRYLLTHGIVSDYAIVADTSHFGITWAECGAVYAKVTLRGASRYTPFTRRSADRRESRNPIIAMGAVIDAIERWAPDYEARTVYRFARGEVHPKVSVNAIAGNVPFKVGHSPETCSIYVDVRTPPGMPPIDAQRELRAIVAGSGVDAAVEFFGSQRGHEGRGVEPVVDAIDAAHELVMGVAAPRIDPAETSMHTDTNVFNESGIPAVKFGIGAALRPSTASELHGLERIPMSTSVDDLVNATKIYAAAALRLCGVETVA